MYLPDLLFIYPFQSPPRLNIICCLAILLLISCQYQFYAAHYNIQSHKKNRFYSYFDAHHMSKACNFFIGTRTISHGKSDWVAFYRKI